jgi:hypothetical protein
MSPLHDRRGSLVGGYTMDFSCCSCGPCRPRRLRITQLREAPPGGHRAGDPRARECAAGVRRRRRGDPADDANLQVDAGGRSQRGPPSRAPVFSHHCELGVVQGQRVEARKGDRLRVDDLDNARAELGGAGGGVAGRLIRWSSSSDHPHRFRARHRPGGHAPKNANARHDRHTSRFGPNGI